MPNPVLTSEPPVKTGEEFNRTFATSLDNGRLRAGGESDKLRHRLVVEEWDKLKRQGWEPVSIANLNTFELSLNLGELGIFTVPARSGREPYSLTVIDAPRLAMRDMGEANYVPISVLPVEIGREFERAYAKTGGVVMVKGDRKPTATELSSARDRQMQWYREELRLAVDSWSRHHQHIAISDRQRDAARALYEAGELAAMPEWTTVSRNMSEFVACPACGENVRKTAKICRFCRWELDPEWAAANRGQAVSAVQAAAPEGDAGPDDEGGEQEAAPGDPVRRPKRRPFERALAAYDARHASDNKPPAPPNADV